MRGPRIKSAGASRVKQGPRGATLRRPSASEQYIAKTCNEVCVMRKLILPAGCLLAACSVSALADTRETEAANLARFQKYAGAPVENFTIWNMYQWQLLGPDTVAVWAGVNDVYM